MDRLKITLSVVFVVLVIVCTLTYCTFELLAQEPEPQDAIVPRAWLPVAGRSKSWHSPHLFLMPNTKIVDPWTPIVVEVHLSLPKQVTRWDAVVTRTSSAWLEDFSYRSGLWAWLVRVDEGPIVTTSKIVIGQRATVWPARSDDALVAVMTLKDSLAWGHQTWLCARGSTNLDDLAEGCFAYLVMGLRGDHNGDGEVHLEDYIYGIEPHYGSVEGDDDYNAAADYVSPYGVIDQADVDEWVRAWTAWRER